ncbi:MAG TPA: hypothetical protein VJS44_08330 [Pyrinomonadaceae bacterium]|nr:hypothetical protein [Pyrinomonadaceae bacterium]
MVAAEEDIEVALHAMRQASGQQSIHGDALMLALEAARDARLLIEEAQKSLIAARDRAKTELERNAKQYQIDLVKWQLTRAADLAEMRLKHLAAIRTQEDVDAELARCADGIEGTIHWFNYYAWGYDPREDAPLKVMPFAVCADSLDMAFGFQERYLRWLEALTFEERTSGLVEKARDMGATVGAIDWVVKQWRFRSGFSAMLQSANEDLVDSKKDPDTLFEKVRFQIRLLPLWMLPGGFSLDRDMPYMNIANPDNGAVISGAAPTANTGRQRRRSFVLCDEFAAWPFGGYPQHTALSQTTKTMLLLSSVQGKFNKYAEVRFSNHTQVFEMDWREHPWKDQRWYDALPFGYLGSPMSAESIAQEVDRNYEASQPGKVFKQWREEYVLITWKELVAYYSQFRLGHKFVDPETGAYRVPDDWSWGRMMDYGQTEGHPWIVSHMATPRENYPLSDSRFIFSMHRVHPTGASPQEGRSQYREIEERLGLLRSDGEYLTEPELSEMSHEQVGEGGLAETLMTEFGDFWEAWDTDYTVGLTQIQQWLTLIDTTVQNPIRPELMGRARLYCVAMDDEYEFVFDKKHQRYFVTPSKTDKGFKLFRREMPAYHYPPEEMGKPVQKMRPQKILDDCIDTVRGFATKWGPTVIRMSKEERRIKKMQQQAGLHPAEVLSRVGQPDFVENYTAMQHAMNQIKIQEEREEEEARRRMSKAFGMPVTHRRYKNRRG